MTDNVRSKIARSAVVGLLGMAVFGCTPPPSGPRMEDTKLIAYLLAKVCIPQIVHGVPASVIAKQEGFHWDRPCDIQECRPSFDKPGVAAVALAPGSACAFSTFENADFAALDATVASALQSDSAHWREAEPVDRSGYSKRYCNDLNSASVSTFGMLPQHASDDMIKAQHNPQYDVNVGRLGCSQADRALLFPEHAR